MRIALLSLFLIACSDTVDRASNPDMNQLTSPPKSIDVVVEHPKLNEDYALLTNYKLEPVDVLKTAFNTEFNVSVDTIIQFNYCTPNNGFDPRRVQINSVNWTVTACLGSYSTRGRNISDFVSHSDIYLTGSLIFETWHETLRATIGQHERAADFEDAYSEFDIYLLSIVSYMRVADINYV